jgi:hypothetical protein
MGLRYFTLSSPSFVCFANSALDLSRAIAAHLAIHCLRFSHAGQAIIVQSGQTLS